MFKGYGLFALLIGVVAFGFALVAADIIANRLQEAASVVENRGKQ